MLKCTLYSLHMAFLLFYHVVSHVMAAFNMLFIINILLWKTTTGKNIVINGHLNGLSQELRKTIFILMMIKLASITKLLI